jgi:hypothetical protein
MITLSDGSTYLHRTTSPTPIYRSTKDTKNNPLWNPSSQKLANVEEDEAGRLKRFRGRFGRGWDAEVVTGAEEVSLFLFTLGDEVGCVITERSADWCDHRCEKAKRLLSLKKELIVCWISFLATDNRRRRRVRRLASLSQSRRVERARAARSECEVNTQGTEQCWRNFHTLLLAVAAIMNIQAHALGRQRGAEQHMACGQGIGGLYIKGRGSARL